MQIIKSKTVTMLGDLVEPQWELFLTPRKWRKVRLSVHPGAMIEVMNPKNGEPFASPATPVIRVEFENTTVRMPIWQFGMN